jgi:hypothetical protein
MLLADTDDSMQSMPSPIVINDKMLTSAVDSPRANPMISGGVGFKCKIQPPTASDFGEYSLFVVPFCIN